MATISVQEIERDSTGWLRRVESGETLVVLRDQQPVAEIKPVPRGPAQERPFALCAGQFTVPDDFDEPLQESVLREFEGQ